MMAKAIVVTILIMKAITVAVKATVAIVTAAISNDNESNGRNRLLKTEQ